MDKYKNKSGVSGISAYEIGTDWIKVQFKNGSVFLYNYQSSGADNLEKMKQLAVAGAGLNTFIMYEIKNSYAAKLN